MEFFASIPRPEPPPRPERPKPPAWIRPDEVVPASLPFQCILLHTPHLAVFADGLRVYPDGLEFTVHVRRPRHASQPARDPRSGNPFGRRDTPDPDADRDLRFGVLFADGRRAAVDRFRGPFPLGQDAEPEQPLITFQGGHGGEGRWDQELWIWGLPKDGPVTLVYSWLAEGIPESTLTLDGDPIRMAAARATVLWPDPLAA